jgi:two-component system, chemotaxis family, CheB/CheR fusion protein
VGAGSVFTVEVPPGRAEVADVPEQGQNEEQGCTLSRGTILVVEDDPVVREVLQLLLDDEGHRTLVAADGAQSIRAGSAGSVPNLVIADYNLPNGFNGLEVTASLRSSSSTKSRRWS